MLLLVCCPFFQNNKNNSFTEKFEQKIERAKNIMKEYFNDKDNG